MGFAERAEKACESAMEEGRVSERQVRDVLRCETSNGRFAVKWLDADNAMVRGFAVRLVAEKGPIGELVRAALVEKDRPTLLEMMRLLGRPGVDIEPLQGMLASEDLMVRDAAVEMFRKAGKAGFLFPMVFSDDDATSARIKRYMGEKGQAV